MGISYTKKNTIFSTILFLCICSGIGILFALFVKYFLVQNDTEPLFHFILLGVLTGAVIPATFLFLDPYLKKLHTMPLWVTIFILPCIYTLVIGIDYGITFSLTFGFKDFFSDSFILETIAFSLVISVVMIFLETVNRLIGQKVMAGLLTGKYHKPVSEERFVMFLDIAGSTSIAEKIGDLQFHSFLNDFFCDISTPVRDNYGDIYKYVGDEVIITWLYKKRKKLCSPLDAFFSVCTVIKKNEQKYAGKYGIVPEFRAGLHYGKVILGEMGSYKQEIAILGDVMNTTSRIQSNCRPLNVNLLVSKAAREKLLQLYAGETSRAFVSAGEYELRGKEGVTELFTTGME
jgi:adenylate cyclase